MRSVRLLIILFVFLLSCSNDKTSTEDNKIVLEIIKLSHTENFNMLDTIIPLSKYSIRSIKNREENFNHFFKDAPKDYHYLLKRMLFDKKYCFLIKNSKIKFIKMTKIYYDTNIHKAIAFTKINYNRLESEEIIFFFKKENNIWKICNQETISVSD